MLPLTMLPKECVSLLFDGHFMPRPLMVFVLSHGQKVSVRLGRLAEEEPSILHDSVAEENTGQGTGNRDFERKKRFSTVLELRFHIMTGSGYDIRKQERMSIGSDLLGKNDYNNNLTLIQFSVF